VPVEKRLNWNKRSSVWQRQGFGLLRGLSSGEAKVQRKPVAVGQQVDLRTPLFCRFLISFILMGPHTAARFCNRVTS
jgi:hypothetical protein